MNIKEEKKKIRKEIRRRRRELSSKTLSAIDNSLPEFISAIGDKELLKTLKNAKRIALYRAFDGEVPVDGLAKFFMDKGITCCFPRIENDRMVFCDCISLDDSEFTVSSLGIKEPDTSKPPVEPGDIDVVVLPALAYNEEGTRLGQGGGYYDKYFAQTDALLVGVCYDFQICSELPFDEHDLTVDILLPVMTEDYEE